MKVQFLILSLLIVGLSGCVLSEGREIKGTLGVDVPFTGPKGIDITNELKKRFPLGTATMADVQDKMYLPDEEETTKDGVIQHTYKTEHTYKGESIDDKYIFSYSKGGVLQNIERKKKDGMAFDVENKKSDSTKFKAPGGSTTNNP